MPWDELLLLALWEVGGFWRWEVIGGVGMWH